MKRKTWITLNKSAAGRALLGVMGIPTLAETKAMIKARREKLIKDKIYASLPFQGLLRDIAAGKFTAGRRV